MVERDLGPLGEATLAAWAAARGITAQRVTVDRYGWDCLLEFPPASLSGPFTLPRDREPASLRCLVQVKATGVGRLRYQVKLTKLHQLITHIFPAFFLVLVFGDDERAQSAYLIHVGESLIEKGLRRIRKLDSQGKYDAQRTFSVGCRSEAKLEAATGEALERAIRRHVGPSLEEYVKWKLNLRESIGYQPAQSELTMTELTMTVNLDELHGMSLPEYLQDLSLGLKPALNIRRAQLKDIRFDIPRVVHELPAGEFAVIQEDPEPVELVLTVGTKVVRAAMEMILPKGLGKVIKPESLKVRFRSRYFDFVVGQSQLNVHFSLDPSGPPQELAPLHEWARVILLFAEAIETGDAVDIVIHSHGQIWIQNALAMHDELLPPEAQKVAEVVRNAWLVAERLGIQDIVRAPIAELLDQGERFSFFNQLLAATTPRIKVGDTFEPEPSEGSRVFVPFGMEVLLGDYKGTVVVTVWGEARRTGRYREGLPEYEVVTDEKRVEKVFATRSDEVAPMSLAAAVNAVVDSYSEGQCWLLRQYVMPETE